VASARGFSHVVQLDADGQHDPAEVVGLLGAAERDPEALVLGDPRFDASAPRSRLYGRRLSQLIVWGFTAPSPSTILCAASDAFRSPDTAPTLAAPPVRDRNPCGPEPVGARGRPASGRAESIGSRTEDRGTAKEPVKPQTIQL